MCGIQVHIRLRLLRHLCDRRDRCWAQVQSALAGTYKALTSKKVEALDAAAEDGAATMASLLAECSDVSLSLGGAPLLPPRPRRDALSGSNS